MFEDLAKSFKDHDRAVVADLGGAILFRNCAIKPLVEVFTGEATSLKDERVRAGVARHFSRRYSLARRASKGFSHKRLSASAAFGRACERASAFRRSSTIVKSSSQDASVGARAISKWPGARGHLPLVKYCFGRGQLLNLLINKLYPSAERPEVVILNFTAPNCCPRVSSTLTYDRGIDSFASNQDLLCCSCHWYILQPFLYLLVGEI